VRRALQDLGSDGVVPVWVNALEAFDAQSLTFADVVLVVAESTIAELARRGVVLPGMRSRVFTAGTLKRSSPRATARH
jgi:hypothetical protein